MQCVARTRNKKEGIKFTRKRDTRQTNNEQLYLDRVSVNRISAADTGDCVKYIMWTA